jgi:hypothetical protein
VYNSGRQGPVTGFKFKHTRLAPTPNKRRHLSEEYEDRWPTNESKSENIFVCETYFRVPRAMCTKVTMWDSYVSA